MLYTFLQWKTPKKKLSFLSCDLSQIVRREKLKKSDSLRNIAEILG